MELCLYSRCWLSTENHFIWSFIGPACLIILVGSCRTQKNVSVITRGTCSWCLFSTKVNLLAFVVIIYKVFRHTAVKKPEVSHYENIRWGPAALKQQGRENKTGVWSPAGRVPAARWPCCLCWGPHGPLECCTSSMRRPSPPICSPSATPSRGCSSSSSSVCCPERYKRVQEAVKPWH